MKWFKRKPIDPTLQGLQQAINNQLAQKNAQYLQHQHSLGQTSTIGVTNPNLTTPGTSGTNFANATWTNNSTGYGTIAMKKVCRMCGKDFLNIEELCDICEKEAYRQVMKMMIPENSEVHCRKCLSHINACICPEKQHMDKLVS